MEPLGQQSTKVHAIYTQAEWTNIVSATTRLRASIGDERLSAWLSAQNCEVETSDISAD